MNYIYDIYLNFDKKLYDFFDWNKNDKIIHIKTIPIIKISESNLRLIYGNNIQLDSNNCEVPLYKSTIWNKPNEYKNYILFCDNINVIAIEFDKNGKSIRKSQLMISDELETIESVYKLKQKDFQFKILSKEKTILKTRKQINDENFIKNELKNIDSDKLNYIYLECFGKKEKDSKIKLNKLLNLSKNSKIYDNLYNILKLTSTTPK